MPAYGAGLYGAGVYGLGDGTDLSEWQASYRGLLIGDGTIYDLVSIKGLNDLTGMRHTDQVLQQRQGGMAGTDWLGPATITLEIDVYGGSPDALGPALQDFAAAFTLGTDDPFLFDIPTVAGTGTRLLFTRCWERTAAIDLSYLRGISKVFVQLQAADPRIYSALVSSDGVGLPTGGGGVTFPLTFPIVFGSPTGGELRVVNDGSFPVEPFLRITGPATNPRVGSLMTDRAMAFNLTLAPGEWLDIDVPNRSVLLNGTADRYSALTRDSRWFELLSGPNDLTFRADDYDAGARLSVTWRSAWV